MRFSEFVVYHALQENNRCLHLLSGYPTPASDHAIQSLRVGVNRLQSSWQLLRHAVPRAVVEDAQARLRTVDHLLAEPHDANALLTAAQHLSSHTTKKKALAALQQLIDSLAHAASRARVSRTAVDHASSGFQQESGVWRDLDPAALSDIHLVGGYARSHRSGRRLGRRVLRHDEIEQLQRLRRWVECSYFQLDMIRPVLSSANRARRWYLDRLADALGKHQDLLSLGRQLNALCGDEAERARIDEVLQTRQAAYRDRVRKLIPYCYGEKGRVVGQLVADDIARLSFDNVVRLPHSA